MAGFDSFIFSIFLIFTGAAVMSTAALYTRQSLLVAYIVLGALLGPFGFKFINNVAAMREIGNVGINFLLFLLGLYLRPQSLFHLLQKTIGVALISSIAFAAIGFGMAFSFGYGMTDSVIIGITMLFSSTIICLKLLPTLVLHHRHTGEVMISILLLQDLIAIVALLLIHVIGENGSISWQQIALIVSSLPFLFIFAYLMQRFVLMRLISRFGDIREYVFLLSVAWCLTMAQLAGYMGLSEGIGAFIAGIAIAANPISEYIAENLKPLRDFFLVIFFFCIGVTFDFTYLPQILLPTLMLSIAILTLKPLVFRFCLRRIHEMRNIATEVAVRLSQMSEFSLLIAYVAAQNNLITHDASSLIQATTIITFIVSSYIVVLFYATPLAVTAKLRRD